MLLALRFPLHALTLILRVRSHWLSIPPLCLQRAVSRGTKTLLRVTPCRPRATGPRRARRRNRCLLRSLGASRRALGLGQLALRRWVRALCPSPLQWSPSPGRLRRRKASGRGVSSHLRLARHRLLVAALPHHHLDYDVILQRHKADHHSATMSAKGMLRRLVVRTLFQRRPLQRTERHRGEAILQRQLHLHDRSRSMYLEAHREECQS